ncbi:MAG: PEGA domain-containing protein [Myxococcota bacterium]
MRLLLAIVVWASITSYAAAQTDDPWLIVPTTATTDDDWIESTASRLRTELLEQGVEVWSLRKEQKEIEAELSKPSVVLTDEDTERWSTASDAAVRAIALGDYAAALEKLNAADAIAKRSVEELNRDPKRARRHLDTCLYRVRVLVETDREAQAREAVRDCQRAVPTETATRDLHPPWVLELLDVADRERKTRGRSIAIDSEPSGCVARLNGVAVGETPVVVEALWPGGYRVQAECDPERHGRVHGAQLTRTDDANVLIESRLDRVLATRPIVHLRYENASEAIRNGLTDAEALAVVLPSGSVLLMSKPTPETVELELIDLSQDGETGEPTPDDSAAREFKPPVPPLPGAQAAALVRINAGARGPSRGDLALAARALAQRQCTDFRGPTPETIPCGGRPVEPSVADAQPPAPIPRRRPKGQFVSGLTLFSLGAASLVTSTALLIPRKNAGTTWVNAVFEGSQDTDSQNRWLTLNDVILGTAAAGGGLLVASMPLILPNRAKTPWWAWLSGGVGLGAAAFSIAYGVTIQPRPSTSCRSDAIGFDDAALCIRRAERTSAAVLAGSVAAPLITMPLVYLLRKKPRVEPTVDAGRGRAQLVLSGRF